MSGTPVAAAATRSAASASRWFVALAVILPTVMEVLDTSIVNVALPYMAGSLSADLDEITWVLTSYLVSNAIVLPMSGWLTRVFGRKRYLMGCVVLFTAASLLCATATSLAAMVVYRVLQGAAGGALQPLSQAILLETFPEEERGPAMAVWGMGIVVAPVVAPLLGGWLTETYTWHWIFLVNLPVGLLALLAVSAFVVDPEYARRRSTRADGIGIALLVVGIGALQIVLDRGQIDDWLASSTIRALMAASALGLVGLVLWERRAPAPVVDLSVLRDRNFSLGCVAMLTFGFALYATLTLVPLFVQDLLGYTALGAGEALAPRGLGVMAAMGLAGRLLRRHDARSVMFVGLPFLVVSSLLLARSGPDTRFFDVAGIMVMQGVGLGFVFVPLTTATMARIDSERMGAATGLFNLLRNIGGSIGIAVSQTVLARTMQGYHALLARHVTPFDPRFDALWQRLVHALSASVPGQAEARRRALALIAGQVDRQAAFLAYDGVFRLFVGAFFLLVPLILAMRAARAEPDGGVIPP